MIYLSSYTLMIGTTEYTNIRMPNTFTNIDSVHQGANVIFSTYTLKCKTPTLQYIKSFKINMNVNMDELFCHEQSE